MAVFFDSCLGALYPLDMSDDLAFDEAYAVADCATVDGAEWC